LTGVLAVSHPERFMIGQKLILSDGVNPAVTGYVWAINKNTGIITLGTARAPAAFVAQVFPLLVEATTRVYIDGGVTTQFGSLRSMLLPASAGGSDTFANKVKLDSPFSQSVLYDAGGVAGTGDWATTVAIKYNDVLDLIFDSMRKGFQLGAEPLTYIMSYKHYSACLKTLEKGSGAFKNVRPSVTYAGYAEMEVGGVEGSCKLVAIREMADDWIAGVNTKYMDFHTARKPFQVLRSPDGLAYFQKRAVTGYTYITDICLAGDFLYSDPWSAVAIHNIPNYGFNTIV
jgi:hypothetical protein